MKLLTKEIRKQLPPLGSTSQQNDPIVVCKFFTPDSSWTWYAIEFDGDDAFYGLVDGSREDTSLTEIQVIGLDTEIFERYLTNTRKGKKYEKS